MLSTEPINARLDQLDRGGRSSDIERREPPQAGGDEAPLAALGEAVRLPGDFQSYWMIPNTRSPRNTDCQLARVLGVA